MGSYYLQDPFSWICDTYWAWNSSQTLPFRDGRFKFTKTLIIHQTKINLFSNVSGFIFPDTVKTLLRLSDFEYFDYKKWLRHFLLLEDLFVELKALYFARAIFNVAQRSYVTHAKEGGGSGHVGLKEQEQAGLLLLSDMSYFLLCIYNCSLTKQNLFYLITGLIKWIFKRIPD